MNPAQVQEMIQEYLGKITGFAYRKTGNKQDADDLAQDIVLELIKTLGRERGDIGNPAAYVYRLAHNVFYRKVVKPKRPFLVELIGFEYGIPDDGLETCLDEDEIATLRREISLLSSTYRDIIIKYYFDNLSVGEIARSKALAEGTVKWWLFEARKQLRKGFDQMRPNGEKSFKPGALHIGISGNTGIDGSPHSLVNDNLAAQNILLAAYEQPLTAEALAQELGIARPYIENVAEKLVGAELMRKSDDSYQTDFVISNEMLSVQNHLCLEENFQVIKDAALNLIDREWDLFESPEVNVAAFPRERLLWTAVFAVMDQLSRTIFDQTREIMPCPQRPNGGCWIALGFDHSKMGDCPEGYRSDRYGFNGPLYSYFDESSYGEEIVFHQHSGYSNPEFIREVIQYTAAKHNPIVLLCIKAAKGMLKNDNLAEEERDCVTDAVRHGLLKHVDGTLKPNFIFMPRARLDVLRTRCRVLNEELAPVARYIADRIAANIKSSAPRNVWEQVSNFAGVDFGSLTPMVLDDLYREGRLSQPEPHDRHILSYYIWG